MTYGHVIPIISKSVNVDFDALDRVAACSYFTKQAFVRGEVVDAPFCFIPAHIRSCWKGIPHPHFAGDQDDKDHAQVTHFGDNVHEKEHNV